MSSSCCYLTPLPGALFATLVAGLPVSVWKKTRRPSSFTEEGIAKNGKAGALECEQASENSQIHLFESQ